MATANTKTDTCKICKAKGVDLHEHHIIPKSRGGDDSKENLVLVCIECHGKAHDVSFRGDSGLISEAMKSVKEAEALAAEWFQDDMMNKLLDSLFYDDEVLYNFLVNGMYLGLINKSLFFSLMHPSYRTRLSFHINLKKEHQEKIKKHYKVACK